MCHTSEPAPTTSLALPDQMERVRLEILLQHWDRQAEKARDRIRSEETAQAALGFDVDRALGRLRQNAEELQAAVQRLEARIERLEYAGQALSDDELDDQDIDDRAESAAFWAEWRQRHEEQRQSDPRRRRYRRKSKKPDRDIRELYRRVARLIHPDLASDVSDRVRRETVMRIANIAYEASDEAQLEQLFNMWFEEFDDERPDQVEELHKAIRQRIQEIEELGKHLKSLERSELGTLLRASDRWRRQYIDRESERLRRDQASLRLRRRRLKRQLESRRDEFSEVSD